MGTAQRGERVMLEAVMFHPRSESFVGLMYHNLCRDGDACAELSPSMTSYFVSSSAFASQLAELRASGARPMGWEELDAFYGAQAGSASKFDPAGQPAAMLTFDDGWAGAVDLGSALLQEHSCKAILFVTTDFLDRPHFLSRAALARLDPNLWHVGSHGRSHRMLSLLPDADIRLELMDSKRLLEDATGYEVQMLSIPSGAVDARVRRIAGECGYRFVFDSEIRVNRPNVNPLKIGRIPLMRHTPISAFRRFIQGRFTQEILRRSVLQGPKRLLGLRRYEAVRRRLLGEQAGQWVTHQS